MQQMLNQTGLLDQIMGSRTVNIETLFIHQNTAPQITFVEDTPLLSVTIRSGFTMQVFLLQEFFTICQKVVSMNLILTMFSLTSCITAVTLRRLERKRL